jgi:hypothetical protein
VYPCGGEAEDNNAYRHGGMAKNNAAYCLGSAATRMPNICVIFLKKNSQTQSCDTMARVTIDTNAIRRQQEISQMFT